MSEPTFVNCVILEPNGAGVTDDDETDGVESPLAFVAITLKV
jgi:hypothetical protein